MRAPTTAKLVRGVHPQTPILGAVRECGWKYRAAVVIDSYVPGLADMYFDSTLFLRFLNRIDELLAASSRHIRVADSRTKEELELYSIAELQDFYHGFSEEERDLPEDIIWFDGAVMIAGGFAEKWYLIGGPDIYHDSFTFSVFSKTEIFPSLAAEADQICAASNSQLLAIYEGAEHA